MTPQQFKLVRESLNVTQAELAQCLGLTQKAVSHYETGFRAPGATVQVVLKTLDRLPPAQAKRIFEIMSEVSEDLKKKQKRKSR